MSNTISNHALLQSLSYSDFSQYLTLPMAVYITAQDGTLLDYNEAAQELLLISEAQKGQVNIIDFYCSKIERANVIEKLSHKKPNEWELNETLEFNIGGVKSSLRFFAKPFFGAGNLYLGSLCLVFKITELERFRALEDIIPIGIFEVDAEEHISYANRKFKEIFNVSTVDLQNARPEDFFLNKQDYTTIKNKLFKEKKATTFPLIKMHRNGAFIIGRLNILPEFNGNSLSKSKGVIVDDTFSNLIDLAPIGLYIAMRNNDLGEDIIVKCNKHFAEIKGYKTAKEIEGKKITDFLSDKSTNKDFLKKLEEAHKSNQILTDYILRITTKDGTQKQVIVHAKVLTDELGNIEGRVGAVYDVPVNIKKELLEKTHNDFGSLLHSFSAMINNVKSTLQAVVTGHDDAEILNGDKVNIRVALVKINKSLERFKKYLDTYYELGKKRGIVDPLIVEKLAKQIAYIDNKVGAESKEQVAFIRRIVKKIRKILREEADFSSIPREMRKSIFNELTEILRYARIISLSITIQEIRDNLWDIETYKEAFILNESENETVQAEVIDVYDVLKDVTAHLDEFAQSRDISIELHCRTSDSCQMKGLKREIYIAFYNLIHNAVKYTWKKTNDNPYISIIIEKDRKNLKVSIKNRGVPIRKQELEEGDIFHFGYRGANSGDRHRRGLGIGLWHAKTIIERHKGRLYLISEPTLGHFEDDYTKPFITTASVIFD